MDRKRSTETANPISQKISTGTRPNIKRSLTGYMTRKAETNFYILCGSFLQNPLKRWDKQEIRVIHVSESLVFILIMKSSQFIHIKYDDI